MKLFTLLLLLHVSIFAKDVTVKQLFNVQTIKVKTTNASMSQKYYGYVKEDDSKVYDVSPRFDGYIEELKANKTYMYVQKGTLLATVYSPEVLRAKEEYLSIYNFTKKFPNKAMVESAKERLTLLGINPREIAMIEKEGKTSRTTGIYAPSSGYIFEKSVTSGSAFSMRQNIFKIVNLANVWVEVAIYPQDYDLISKLNDFLISSPAGNFKAKKEMLYPRVSAKDAPLTLRVSVQNPKGKLIGGMYVSVSADTKKESYLTLPSSAVIFKNGKYYVFVKGQYQGEYEPRVIEAKELDANTYSVKGLQNGDEVVNNALFMMDSDAQINGLY
jgi:Cu(I)/Ag(I) efflux system membrane fusion protein